LTDPLVDTATASSIRRGYSAWSSERRSQDYYVEGELLWLEADAIIKQRSNGARSLDDVARAFFGHGHDTGPEVDTFHRDDLIAALNAVQPYDWKTFLETRVDKIAPHPPDPFSAGGYQLVYTDKPSDYEKLVLGERKAVDLWYSLGISARTDGTVIDVSTVSVAGKAGLSPTDKIVAVDGRAFAGQDQADDALRTAEKGSPVQLLVLGGGVYRTLTLDYRGGPRYPHLERVAGAPDILGAIAKPLRAPK
jgi:predicted metalloprotease with PDZ domain